MNYRIKIDIFEGPFDLLYHLIEKNEIDLYHIPMTEITEQYIQYLKNMEELDLEITSEFLVMAATLIEIKSKMLLPAEKTDDEKKGAEEDPRNELVKKLVEYKKYKEASQQLKLREEYCNRLYFKPREEIITDNSYNSKELESMDIKDLLNAFRKTVREKHKKSYNYPVRKIQKDIITIQDKIIEIQKYLFVHPFLDFFELFSSLTQKSEKITAFLALLELIKMKKVIVRQSKVFGSIIIQNR